MSKSSEVAELLELANGGHPGVIMGGPIREGMSRTVVLPEVAELFDAASRESRKKNSQAVLTDDDLSAHKLVMGRGKSLAFASMRKPSSKTTGLLACLLRRV